jgi:hypothetical protein
LVISCQSPDDDLFTFQITAPDPLVNEFVPHH